MSASIQSVPVQRLLIPTKRSFPASRLIDLDADFEDNGSETPRSASNASLRDASLSPSICRVAAISISATLPQDHDSRLRCVSNGSDASTEPGSSSEAESCDTYGKKATSTVDEVRSRGTEGPDARSYKSPPWAKKPSAPKGSVKVGLVSSPTSWVALQQQRRLRADSDANRRLTEDEFGRKIRGILNKLTLERFDALYEQLASSGIESPEHVIVLVREIFEKAITQHSFIPMYGDLCQRLEADARIVTVGSTSNANNFFKRILLNQCQTSFEEMLNGSSESVNEVQNAEEAEEARLRSKARVLGNINFIGRLLVQGMLASKLLISLANELLRSYSVCSDALECVAALLTVTGPTFDSDATWQHQGLLAAIFDQLEVMIKDRSIQSRVRFLLRDVLDLRAARWKDKRVATNQKARPTKLDDVRSVNKHLLPAAPLRRDRTRDANVTKPIGKSDLANSPKSGSTDVLALNNLIAQNRPVPALRGPSFPSSTDAVPVAAVEVSPSGVLSSTCEKTDFSLGKFHKELWATMQTMVRDGDVTEAVTRIKKLDVPLKHQAEEFADFLARVSDEPDASARKIFLQLAARLGDPDSGAFSTTKCLDGVKIFFNEIVSGLCEEDPQLRTVVKLELLPALRATLPEVTLCLGVAHHVWLLE